MNDMHTATISALVDGEYVDPAELAQALEDAEARAALVDFVRLRREVLADTAPLPPSLASLRRPARIALVTRWAAAAALLVLVFLAGLIAPRPWTGTSSASPDSPPAPVRTEEFVPGVDWHSQP
jgi:hypothetical protein